MGLFNLFSRAKSHASDQSARCDHYSFAHVVLRDAAFEDPTQIVTTLASAKSQELLGDLWDGVLALCREHSQTSTIATNDILIHKIRVGTFPCAVVEMPTPQHATEAFFVALVLAVHLAGDDWEFEPEPLRYFTLEYSEAEHREIKTVLGEWKTRSTYVNHGPGPAPTIDDFVARVSELAIIRRIQTDQI